ncbi:MAG: hypothetical protein HYV14_06235 [Elusimicrobia bacterium]|nr:hypothetical protein [Elusimicrobiota bacterium]
MKIRALGLLLAALCACGRKAAESEAKPSALESAVRMLAAAPPCSSRIPQEWSPSRPVPTLAGGSLRYRIFFFGREGDPTKGFTFHAPQGEAAFTPAGRVLDCRRLAGPPRTIARDARFDSTPLADILARSSELYSRTEAVAALFASGRDPGGEGRAKIAAFCRDFAGLADPSHAAAYRALAPDFWSWVEKNGGSAPAPAK